MFIPDPTFFPSWIPDPGSELSPSRIPDPGSSSKNLSILTPKKAKKWFLSSKKYDPGCSSRIPDPDDDFLPSWCPDPGSRIQGSKRHPISDPDPQHWLQRDVVYLCWPIAPSYTSPNSQWRGNGGGGVAGSQPMNTTWLGAQINFGDLPPPYLTYVTNLWTPTSMEIKVTYSVLEAVMRAVWLADWLLC
jgi:hypothetical protein